MPGLTRAGGVDSGPVLRFLLEAANSLVDARPDSRGVSPWHACDRAPRRDHARSIPGKSQLFIEAFARALEVIPRQLADNSGFDATGGGLAGQGRRAACCTSRCLARLCAWGQRWPALRAPACQDQQRKHVP